MVGRNSRATLYGFYMRVLVLECILMIFFTPSRMRSNGFWWHCHIECVCNIIMKIDVTSTHTQVYHVYALFDSYTSNTCGRKLNNIMFNVSVRYTNVSVHKCAECGRTFASGMNLNNPRLVQMGAKTHKCKPNGCDKAYVYTVQHWFAEAFVQHTWYLYEKVWVQNPGVWFWNYLLLKFFPTKKCILIWTLDFECVKVERVNLHQQQIDSYIHAHSLQ